MTGGYNGIKAFVLLFICCVSWPALAYVGPGPGLSMVGSFFTLVASLVIALLMVLLWPLRLLMKRLRRGKKAAATIADNEPAGK